MRPRSVLFSFIVLLAACSKPKPRDVEHHGDRSTSWEGHPKRHFRFRAGGRPTDGRETPRPAMARPFAKGDELGGPNATGRVGDWVIENSEVKFVIDGLGGGGGFAESGGNLVDAADAITKKDELGQVFTYFGTFPRQAVYTSIDGKSEGGPERSAAVVVKGTELYEPDLEVVTTYRLSPGQRWLDIVTTLKNQGQKTISGLGLGDAIQWGGTEKWMPGKPVGFKGRTSGGFVGGIGRFVSYAITTNGSQLDAISGGAWTDTEQKKNVTLEPGAEITYQRMFVVGQRADRASIQAELPRINQANVAAVEVVLVDAKGAAVPAPRGATVTVGTKDLPDVMTIVATGESAAIGGEVLPGEWLVKYAPSAGRRGDDTTVAVRLFEGSFQTVHLKVSDALSSKLGPCTEDGRPVPCKLTVQGIAPATDPDFGPSHVAGPAKNQITLSPGEAVTVPLSAGKYTVTASRGPEYALSVQEIDAGKDAAFTLRRVVTTPGYVACDFHQHTMLSADSGVATRDRVIANAAEGVEIAVATEHNVVADFMPIVKELGLSPFLVAIAGDELTSDASKKPWGHANVWPLPVDDTKARGGALPVRDRTPKTVFAELRALPGGPRSIVVNHPRTKSNGYFDLLGFDAKTGTSTDPAYDGTYDGMEIWSGRHIGARDHVMVDWFGLLRNGHPTTPIAATDTHGIVGQEAGYPRTYVRVTKDDALDAWSDDRTAELVKAVRATRDVILTNGPFVTVSANGKGIGSLVKAKPGGVVEVKVRVVTASWNAVERAEIRRVRDEAPAKIELSPPKNENGAIVREATTSFKTTGDDAFVVIVNGDKPMRPVLAGDADETRPSAVTGPIWIDFDGDGKALGR